MFLASSPNARPAPTDTREVTGPTRYYHTNGKAIRKRDHAGEEIKLDEYNQMKSEMAKT